MQAPTQEVGLGGQTLVGVQMDAVPQGPLLPKVQGISGGAVGVAMQRPPQVEVCVQIEPVGHGFPPNVQTTVNALR